MGKSAGMSLNKKLNAISMTVFIPMALVMVYLLVMLSNTTQAYTEVTNSISYANKYSVEFKERMDYSMYLAMVGKKSAEELGSGVLTVNGVRTVNPYEYIDELIQACDELSELATVRSNRNQITRLKNSLNSLEHCVEELEKGSNGEFTYEESMEYLEQNIYGLTTLIQKGIQDYIYVETTNYDNVRSELDARNAKVFAICIAISVIAIGVAMFLTLQSSRSITIPIRRLCDLTQKVAEGDFTVKTKVENSDEISVLTESFNDMTQEIGVLVDNIRKQQEDLHIAETKLLQAQINPHFLYNTLDAIVWLAEEHKNEEVISMVTALSDFFRTTLSKGKDFITVKEEKSHIESYLKIQQFRYQDIMDYQIDIDEELYEYIIPKLTLQPLVENALYHGVKNKRGRGMIQIIGKKEGDRMIFKVIDNGKGMSQERLERLREDIRWDKKDPNTEGFGLINVNQRIHHYYGEDYGLYYQSKEDEGTEATVVIEAKNIQSFR